MSICSGAIFGDGTAAFAFGDAAALLFGEAWMERRVGDPVESPIGYQYQSLHHVSKE